MNYKIRKRHFTFLFFLVIAFYAKGQPISVKPFCSSGIFYDQDYSLEMFGLDKLNEDRNYTMGLGLYYSSSNMKNWFLFKPQQWLFRKLHPSKKDSTVEINSLLLANGSFTPDSLPARYPIYNDRPYASLTYLQTKAAFLDIYKHRIYSITFNVGVLGSSISREAQTFIHTRQNNGDTKNPRTPRGWGFQISNGGLPTLLVGYQQDFLITKKPLDQRESGAIIKTARVGGEWKAAWNVNLGWYNLASGELSYRFGLIDPRNWMYSCNPLGQSNMLKKTDFEKSRDKYYAKKREGEVYLFANVRTNLVGYNVLLSGQGSKDAVTLPNSWARHGVVDGAAGLCISPVISQKVVFDFKGKFNFRSPEFKAPGRKPRWHYWGGLDLVVTVLHE